MVFIKDFANSISNYFPIAIEVALSINKAASDFLAINRDPDMI